MKSPESISVYCIYCDDVRDEANAKETIVGWYRTSEIRISGDKGIHLPVFCILTIVQVPISIGVDKLIIELMQDDNVVQKFDVPVDPLREGREKDALSGSKRSTDEIVVNIKLTNFSVHEPCSFFARVTVNNEVFEGNRISFVM